MEKSKKKVNIDYYSADFKKNAGKYSSKHYETRNISIAEKIKAYNPKIIFEVAGAEGNLAFHILKNNNIQKYIFSDYCPEAIELAKKQIGDDPRIEFIQFDANNSSEIANLEFDTFICNSLEHIQNDRELIRQLKPNTLIITSLPNFLCEGHLRSFKTLDEVKGRYSNMIDFIDIEEKQAIYSSKKLFIQFRAFLYRNRYNKFIDFVSNALGVEIIGNKKKFNIIGRKK